MEQRKILSIRSCPELMEKAARWFSQKWSVPVAAYLESMGRSLAPDAVVPAWYVIPDEVGGVLAGLGVIENDFHRRPDLTPNLCAIYVTEGYRMQGIARQLIDHACTALARQGIEDVYLITGHTQFYEHCGFRFYGMIEEEDGNRIRMYHRSLLPTTQT